MSSGLPRSVREVLDGDARWAMVQGEALELLRSLPDASIDALITDPPYSSGGAFRGDRAAGTGTKYVKHGARIVGPDFAGDTRSQLGHLAWCTLWLTEALRVAKPGAPVVIWSDWRQDGLAALALEAGGWIYRGKVVWTKKGAGRPQRGRPRCDAEYALWGSKGPMPLTRAVGGPSCVLAGHVHAAPVKVEKRRHQTEKPLAVMREIVRICTPGGIILDPFAGGGSTGLAALAEGYRFVGGEVVPEYWNRCVGALLGAA